MGYTHYWRRAPRLSTDAFKLFVGDVRDLAAAVAEKGIKLAGGAGGGEPEITNQEVCFNGLGEEDMFETFFIDRVFQGASFDLPDAQGRYFVFCKTSQKPYDLMVVASLFAAKYRFGDQFIFSSDGRLKDGNVSALQDGYDLWIKTCNPVNPPALIDLTEKK